MNKNIKKVLAEVANLLSLDFLIKVSKQELLLPFYHTVSDVELQHVKHLYPVLSLKRFNHDLDFFQKKFEPVSHHFLLDNVKNNSLSKKRVFYLSFDDGLREFHDVVAPVLVERGIPATFFVNSAYVDNKDMFYRLKISILIEKIISNGISTGQQKYIKDLFRDNGLKYEMPYDLKMITDFKKHMADEIAELVDVSFDEYLSTYQPYLTTLQIENLLKQGFTIGSHSVSHPYYPSLNEEQQLSETLECLEFLKTKFGIKDRLFSFPYTDFDIKKSFFKEIISQVDLTFGTANLKLDKIETNFQRIPMEIEGCDSGESIVKTEYILFIIKMLLNKHIIYRS